MTPADAIAMLDRQLGRHGSDVVLSRGAESKTVKGFPRGYRGDEVAGGIEQGDSLVVISPSGLTGSVFASVLPERGDWVSFGGRKRHVENADPVLVAGVVVRINLQVRG